MNLLNIEFIHIIIFIIENGIMIRFIILSMFSFIYVINIKMLDAIYDIDIIL